MHGSSKIPQRLPRNQINPQLKAKSKNQIKPPVTKPIKSNHVKSESSASKLPPISTRSMCNPAPSQTSTITDSHIREKFNASTNSYATRDQTNIQTQNLFPSDSPKTNQTKSDHITTKFSHASSTSSMSTQSDRNPRQKEKLTITSENHNDNTNSLTKSNQTLPPTLPNKTDSPSSPRNNQYKLTQNDSETAKDTVNNLSSDSFISESTEGIFYTGLENQGATCYMNSVLQSLYHLPLFRSSVLQIPTSDEEDPEHSIALNLQALFYIMEPQKAPHSVPTVFLTKSFGWDSHQAFEQQDLQEFFRVLLTKLDDKIDAKNKKNEKKKIDHVSAIFKGQTVATISGKTDDFVSERFEDFYDISLNIKGLTTLENVFNNYTKKEDLSDSYDTGIEGKEKISVEIQIQLFKLPKVLTIHLQRFEYDFIHDTLTKIYDELQYPLILDLTPFVHKNSEHAKPEMEKKYVLLGILVHSGDAFFGHYYAYLQPFVGQDVTDEHFYQFNDTLVSEAKHREVFEDNFGGFYQMSQSVSKQPKRHSAYMLIYGRLDCLNEIFNAKMSISKNIKEYAESLDEVDDQPQIEVISFLTESAIKNNIQKGKSGIYNPDALRTISVNAKATSTESLYNDIANQLRTDMKQIRLWEFDAYDGLNNALVPSKDIIKHIPSTIYVQSTIENQPFAVKPTQILFIYKLYTCIKKEPIQYAFSALHKRSSSIEKLKTFVKSVFSFSEDCTIRLFEELDYSNTYYRKNKRENQFLRELADDQQLNQIPSLKNGSIIIIEPSERIRKETFQQLHFQSKKENEDTGIYNYVDTMIPKLPANVLEFYDLKFNVTTITLYDYLESSNAHYLTNPYSKRDIDPCFGKFSFPRSINLDQLLKFFNSEYEFDVDSESEQVLFKYSPLIEGPLPYPVQSIDEIKPNSYLYIFTKPIESTNKLTVNIQYSKSSYRLSSHFFYYMSSTTTVKSILKHFSKDLSNTTLRPLLVNQHRIIRELDPSTQVSIFTDSILRIDNVASIKLASNEKEIRVFNAVVRKNSDSLIPMDFPFILAVGITETAESVKKRIGQVLGYSLDRLNHIRLYCANDDDFVFNLKNVLKKEDIVYHEIQDPQSRSLIIVHSSEQSFRNDNHGLEKDQGVQIK